MKRLAVRLSTRYANRSAGVFAPSQSVVDILRKRGVTAPILVVPTGVRMSAFDRGNVSQFRNGHGYSKGRGRSRLRRTAGAPVQAGEALVTLDA
jgi:hypothetical protein